MYARSPVRRQVDRHRGWTYLMDPVHLHGLRSTPPPSWQNRQLRGIRDYWNSRFRDPDFCSAEFRISWFRDPDGILNHSVRVTMKSVVGLTMVSCTSATVATRNLPIMSRNSPTMSRNSYTMASNTYIKPPSKTVPMITPRIVCSVFDMATATIISGVNTSRKMDAHTWNRFDTRRRATRGNRERL